MPIAAREECSICRVADLESIYVRACPACTTYLHRLCEGGTRVTTSRVRQPRDHQPPPVRSPLRARKPARSGSGQVVSLPPLGTKRPQPSVEPSPRIVGTGPSLQRLRGGGGAPGGRRRGTPGRVAGLAVLAAGAFDSAKADAAGVAFGMSRTKTRAFLTAAGVAGATDDLSERKKAEVRTAAAAQAGT